MSSPKRFLEDGDAPRAALSLLSALSPPKPPTLAQETRLLQHLAMVAKPAALAPAASVIWVKSAAVLGALGLSAVVALHFAPGSQPSPAPQVKALVAPLAAALVMPLLASAASTEDTEATKKPQLSGVVNGARAKRADKLAREEALLEQARALANSAPGQSLAVLRRYQKEFPSGQLTAERLFLTVDVLNRLGDAKGARRQTEALIRAFPSSSYAAQLRARNP